MGYNDLFSFYRSSSWEKLRARITAERVNEDGDLLCEHCGKVIIHPYDAVCHHVIELDETNVHDASIALNPDNIQVVCRQSHNQIHERFGYRSSMKRICIVWGSPCAGKRAYVDSVAGKEDMIIDIDALYGAIGACGNRGTVKGNVMALYRTLIDMVRTRNGRWRTAWVLRGLPLGIDRDMLVRDCGGGELLHIDTPMDDCLAEAKQRGGDWEDWVRAWWDRYDNDRGYRGKADGT